MAITLSKLADLSSALDLLKTEVDNLQSEIQQTVAEMTGKKSAAKKSDRAEKFDPEDPYAAFGTTLNPHA